MNSFHPPPALVDRPHQPRSRGKRLTGNGSDGAVYDRSHKCVFPGCHKAFTRSEHLRRHQLNHEASQSWSCTSCSATFVRKDLWQRHLKVSHHGRERSNTRRGDSSETPQVLASHHTTPDDESREQRGSDGSCTTPTSASVQSPRLADGQDERIAELPGLTGQGWEGPPSDSPSSLFGLFGFHDLEEPIDLSEDVSIEWFLNNQYFAEVDTEDQGTSGPVWDGRLPSPVDEPIPIRRVPPAFFQETQSKLFVAKTGNFDPPDCGFRVCNALTEDKREELLAVLRAVAADVDLEAQIFSLNSMRHGIHLYYRHINIEYTFMHPEFLFPSSAEIRRVMRCISGPASEPSPLLLWAVISIGWSLMRSHNNTEHSTGVKIQRALRFAIINHPGLTWSPPLWLVQALFLVLLFARYQGDREEYGFASIFHGVLLEATRRLDHRSSRVANDESQAVDDVMAWIRWVEAESIQRLVRLAFILDVKHCILHGGEPTMVPFDLNIKLYGSEDAWYATSASEWAHLFALNAKDSFYFIDFLKMLWNPRAKTLKSEKLPRGSNIALYGIVSVARELCRRNDLRFLDQSGDSLMSLGKTVSHSLANWELLWRKVAIPSGLTSNFLWRDCTCMLNLAYTLYEIGPVDLQTVAGKDMIEGKKRVAADYVRSRRKMSRWVKEDRAWLGVSRAAAVIQERLYELKSTTVHCHHCLWCLYLAGLICWNFGFALTGTCSSANLVQNGQVRSIEQAKEECSYYLQIASSLAPRYSKDRFYDALGKTTGMLIVLIDFLRDRCQTGMITEGIELLARLVRL